MSISSVFYITRKELKGYFVSPVAYIVMVVFLVVTGWLYFSPFFLTGRADMRDFFSLLPVSLVFFIPAITMRTYAEEFGSGSYEILYTLPVTNIEILLGKFIGAHLFVLILLTPTLVYPVWISTLGPLDWGPVAGGYIGALLLSGTYCAIGILASSLTRNQIVAFISATAVCFVLFMIDKMLFLVPRLLTNPVQFLSSEYHFRNVSRGIIDTRDIVYFLSLIFLSLYFTHLATAERD